MASERLKRHDFLALTFITKYISKKLFIKIIIIVIIIWSTFRTQALESNDILSAYIFNMSCFFLSM